MVMQGNSFDLQNLMGKQRRCQAALLEINVVNGVVGKDVGVWVEAFGEVVVLVG